MLNEPPRVYLEACHKRAAAALTAIGQVLDEAPDAIDRCAQRRALSPNWQTLWLAKLAPLRRHSDFDALASRLGFVEYWARYGLPDVR